MLGYVLVLALVNLVLADAIVWFVIAQGWQAGDRLEANRPSIIRVALGFRFGVLAEAQPVGADSVDNRDQEAVSLVAAQLTYQEDSEEDQDNDREER